MSDASQVSAEPSENASQFLEKIQPKLLVFAAMQLGDDDMAEDMVQEAVQSALKNSDSFRGEAAFKTWVYSILKRKIAEYLRTQKRAPIDTRRSRQNKKKQQNLDILFDAKGRWHSHFRPLDWGDPYEEMSNERFWVVFDTCLNDLPEKQCTIFMMREYLELTPSEIRKTLNVSMSLVNVNLYRARLSLHRYLSIRWFGGRNA